MFVVLAMTQTSNVLSSIPRFLLPNHHCQYPPEVLEDSLFELVVLCPLNEEAFCHRSPADCALAANPRDDMSQPFLACSLLEEHCKDSVKPDREATVNIPAATGFEMNRTWSFDG